MGEHGGGGREWRRAAHCWHEFALSREQRIVLHCVLRMKLFVARNAFAQSRKMLSMNELIEQNSQVQLVNTPSSTPHSNACCELRLVLFKDLPSAH